MSFDRIPLELQNYAQWVCWKSEIVNDKKTKIPLRASDGKRASVTDPRDWNTFEAACNAAQYCDGIGFVFTRSDPFCGIDLDNPAGDEKKITQQQAVFNDFRSYAEISPSGNGLHIIVKCVLPGGGRRRNGIEIYDNGRFFTFTGNVYSALEIAECQANGLALYNALGPLIETQSAQPKGDEPEIYTDDQVIAHASAAKNGDKFDRLWAGNYEQDYPSQSEADFALINMLTFYSRNTAQTVRMFRNSGLGQREKAKRGQYVGLMVKRSFDRMPAVVQAVGQPGVWFDATHWTPWDKPIPNRLLSPFEAPAFLAAPTLAPPTLEPPTASALPPIPGLLGDIMRYAYGQAPYPVPEIAMTAALAMMSLLCGRTYRVGTNGLTLYLLILAKTSTGKSFGYQAQNAIRNALLKALDNPMAGQQYKQRADFIRNMFIGQIGSGPGLSQHLIEHPSTLGQLDEFVKVIRRIGDRRANPNDMALGTELLQLTDMAKPGAVFFEKTYSNRGIPGKSKNLRQVVSACLTIHGTGTPAEFYDNLSPALLNEGLIPRFSIFEYEGVMPEQQVPITDVPPQILNTCMKLIDKLFMQSEIITGNDSDYTNITITGEAQAELNKWKKQCRAVIVNAQREELPTIGLWSRAMDRVTQIAGLIAVGCNILEPEITLEYVLLAKDIVEQSVSKLTQKIVTGETSDGDTRLEAEILKITDRIKREGLDFLRACSAFSDFAAGSGYYQVSIIKYYAMKRSAFNNHKMGGSRAFDDILRSMVQMGYYEQVVLQIGNNRKVICIKPLY